MRVRGGILFIMGVWVGLYNGLGVCVRQKFMGCKCVDFFQNDRLGPEFWQARKFSAPIVVHSEVFAVMGPLAGRSGDGAAVAHRTLKVVKFSCAVPATPGWLPFLREQ